MRADGGFERADLRPERAGLRPDREGLRPVTADSRPLFEVSEAQFEALGGGRTNERTHERKSPCVLQDFVPFGAAALLPLTQIHNHAKQGNGYR